MDNDNRFGKWLGRQLELRELSQSAFARRMETGNSTVSNWILGYRVPTPASCDRISDILNIPLDQVLTEAGHRVEMPSELPGDVAEVATIMQTLPETHRNEVLAFARWRLHRSRREAS